MYVARQPASHLFLLSSYLCALVPSPHFSQFFILSCLSSFLHSSARSPYIFLPSVPVSCSCVTGNDCVLPKEEFFDLQRPSATGSDRAGFYMCQLHFMNSSNSMPYVIDVRRAGTCFQRDICFHLSMSTLSHIPPPQKILLLTPQILACGMLSKRSCLWQTAASPCKSTWTILRTRRSAKS